MEEIGVDWLDYFELGVPTPYPELLQRYQPLPFDLLRPVEIGIDEEDGLDAEAHRAAALAEEGETEPSYDDDIMIIDDPEIEFLGEFFP